MHRLRRREGMRPHTQSRERTHHPRCHHHHHHVVDVGEDEGVRDGNSATSSHRCSRFVVVVLVADARKGEEGEGCQCLVAFCVCTGYDWASRVYP